MNVAKFWTNFFWGLLNKVWVVEILFLKKFLIFFLIFLILNFFGFLHYGTGSLAKNLAKTPDDAEACIAVLLERTMERNHMNPESKGIGIKNACALMIQSNVQEVW